MDTQVVSFPNQEAIIAYINTHPIKEYGIDVLADVFPNSLSKVATYFENKTMPRSEIETIVRDLFTPEKNRTLGKALRNLIQSAEENKVPNQIVDNYTAGLKKALSILESDEKIAGITAIYNHALTDLLDGATFTPPKEGGKIWTRHVPSKSKT